MSQPVSVNRSRFRAGWLAALCLAAASPAAPAAGAVAMVTDLSGAGTIREAGRERSVDVLANLAAGSEVRTEAGSRLALVYLASAREYRYEGAVSVRIAPGAPELLSGAPSQARSVPLAREVRLVAPVRDLAQAALVLRGERDKKKLRLLEPVETEILRTHPTFRWEALADGIQYRFVLLDAAGRSVIETLVNGTSFRLPDEVAIREGETYEWRLGARLASGDAYNTSAEFTLLEAAQRAKLARLAPGPGAPFTERVLYAALLEQRDLKDAARRAWRALAAERPGDRELEARSRM